VVWGEWRARLLDSVGQRLQREELSRQLGTGSRYVERFPIGQPAMLQGATPAPLARFYRDWYRPDLMAVIAVGDFDPKVVEREIRQRFGDIPMVQTPRMFEHPSVPTNDTTVYHIIRDKMGPLTEISWPAPSSTRSAVAAVRQTLVEELLFPYLGRLAARASRRERRPFASAAVGRVPGGVRSMTDRYVIRVASSPDSLLSGFAMFLGEVERVARHGLPLDILTSEKAALLRRYEHAAAEASATSSDVLVERYSNHYLSGKGDLSNPTQTLALVREILPTIGAQDFIDLARGWRTADRRVARVQIPFGASVRTVTEAELRSVFDSLATVSMAEVPPAPFTVSTVVPQTAPSGGPTRVAGKITATHTDRSTGITTWTLSNGVRVVFKSMMNNPDEVIVHAYSQGGHSLLPDSLFYSSGRLVTMLMTSAGRLGDQQREVVEQQMRAGGLKQFRVSLNAFDEEILVGGSPHELETMLQLLSVQFTAPKVDTLRLEEWRRSGTSSLYGSVNDQVAAQVGQRPRLSLPQWVNVPFIDLDQAMRVYRDRFADASDFTFYIVGAVDTTRIVPFIERYLATLPSTNRPVRERPKSLGIPLPKQTSVFENRYPEMAPERAMMSIAFVGATLGQSMEHLAERRKAEIVSMILSRRLRNRLREQMAVTYSVSAPIVFYRTPEERYMTTITLTTAPDAMERSRDAVWEEINALRTAGPSSEEIQTAIMAMRRQVENARQHGEWWLAQLEQYDRLGVPFDRLGSAEIPLFSVEEIRKAAGYYLSEIYQEQTALPLLESLKQ